MKAVEQQQPNSMESSDSGTGGNEYAYRPLTTKHRRAGSTGTTGDEEYTTDEDEIYADEADCSGVLMHVAHPVLKSDLARAATDLFGYSTPANDNNNEPTSLFDDDDGKFSQNRSSKASVMYNYNEKLVDHEPFEDQASMNKNKTVERTCETPDDVVLKQKKNEAMKNPPEKDSENPNLQITTPYKINEVFLDQKSLNQVLKTDSEMVGSSPSTDACSLRPSEEPPSPTTFHWEKAIAEVKEHAITKLQEELKRAHEELKLKDEEVTRLSRFRQDVETELEELTASLFQEAHNMVREANTRQATAERLLEESRMKTEVLAAEVAALKTLVLTSTPAHPNPHLHPQIDGRCKSNSTDDGQIGLFTKKHRRSPLHFNLKYGRENSPPESPTKEPRSASLFNDIPIGDGNCDRDRNKEQRDRDKDREQEIRDFGIEIDPIIHSEFLRWKCNPCVDTGDSFVARVFREDIDLCLEFPNEMLGTKVRQAVLDGVIFIEAISDKSKLAFVKICALLEVPRQCHYRMRLGDEENQWYCISHICRNRIIAVCEFLNYLRYVERGLVKSSVHDIYWEITRLRKEMVLARLGLALSS